MPQTYDELLEIVDTLKGKGITPCNLGISDPWPGTIPYMMIFNRLNGNDLYESVVLNKEADFANEGFVNAGNKLQELVNSGMFIETIAAISQEEAQQKFMAGDSAMIIDGSWAAPNYIAALGDDVGVFNFPEIEGGKGSADDWLMNFDNAYAISSLHAGMLTMTNRRFLRLQGIYRKPLRALPTRLFPGTTRLERM